MLSDSALGKNLMPRVKLVLKGFVPIRGDKQRRYTNPKTNEIISRRSFNNRARRVEPEQQKPKAAPKQRESQRKIRARWYANHVNREAWLEDEGPDAFISFDQAMRSPEFLYYEHLIRSPYKEDRDTGYEYFEELEQEFLTQDWGETP